MEQVYKYMVCTSCMTFNHASYILDAMNGFTMQETTFPVYYLITDDASTDGEPEVIRQYLSEHFQTPYRVEETDDYNLLCAIHKSNPNCIFIVYLLKYNHYSIKKPKFPYQSEWRDNSKYIALCEGDDYWTDNHKLEKQVYIMECNEDIGFVYGKAKTYDQETQQMKDVIGESVDGIEDLIYCNKIPTLTVLYRAKIAKGYVSFRQKEWKMGDYPLWLYLCSRAKCSFCNNVLGVYRKLFESASHSQSYDKRLAFLESTYNIQKFFHDSYKVGDLSIINDRYYQGRFSLAYIFNNRADAQSSFPKVKKNLKNIIKYVKVLFNT